MMGVYLTGAEADRAARELFAKLVGGHSLEGQREQRKPDGLLFCFAQSAGAGGYRWTVEIMQSSWAQW